MTEVEYDRKSIGIPSGHFESVISRLSIITQPEHDTWFCEYWCIVS
jgi:hypothetical protein